MGAVARDGEGYKKPRQFLATLVGNTVSNDA
jgi:hypothetical protein